MEDEAISTLYLGRKGCGMVKVVNFYSFLSFLFNGSMANTARGHNLLF